MTDGTRESYSTPPSRRRRRRRRSYKSLYLLLAMALIIGGMVGGSLAWLLDGTHTINNTFTDSHITIDLSESTGNSYEIVPGWTIAKDPKVTVSKDSEDCYLFVEITENAGSLSGSFKDYLDYSIADGWFKLENDGTDSSDVYYRTLTDITRDLEFGLLANDQIQCSEDITMEMMAAIDGVDAQGNPVDTEVKPSLSFQAYAVQLHRSNNLEDNTYIDFTPSDAWENARALNQ